VIDFDIKVRLIGGGNDEYIHADSSLLRIENRDSVTPHSDGCLVETLTSEKVPITSE
jgi:hypothetical protein